MPIYDQVFPAGALQAIPLLVDGNHCGYLGSGAGKSAAKGCTVPPINLSGIVQGP
jgi:hypothetical protein